MPSPLNVAIIGFGRIGAEHAGWIGRCPSLRVALVVDPTPDRRAKAEAMGLATRADVDGFLAGLPGDAGVDAVLISTPSSMHFAQAMAAVRAGKHVMVEKPVALTHPDAAALRDEAAARGVTLSVFHNRRWDVDYLTVRQAIRSGALGKVINVESRLGQFASCVGPAAREYRPNWRNEATFGGGGLYDWGSHFLDQIWQLMLPAKVTRVFAQLRANVWSADCDDFARVLLDFDSGAAALVEINTTTARPLPRWHLDGTLGSASSPPSPTFDTHQWAQLQFTPAPAGEPTRLPLAAPGLDEPAIWSAFAAAVRGAGVPAVPIDTVLPTMRLLDAARASARTGQAINLNAIL